MLYFLIYDKILNGDDLILGTDINETTKEMLAELVDEDSELISIYYGADVSEDDWIFEKDSIEDIIRVSIEILDKKIQKVLSEQDNLFGGMSYGLPDESSKTFINKEIKELKKEKKAF